MADLATARDSVLAELERVLESSVFESAGRSRTLLKFVVEETLNGRADRLKEYTIGAEALDKGGSFDPRTDPIVRAEVSRLRTRLERYFADAGRADPIVITLPKGSYIPQFVARAEAPSQVHAVEESKYPGTPPWPRLILVAVMVLAAFGAGVLIRSRSGHRSAQRVAQLDVALTSREEIGGEVGTSIVMSPDGARVVFVASGPDGVPHLHLRRLDQGKSRSCRVLRARECRSFQRIVPG